MHANRFRRVVPLAMIFALLAVACSQRTVVPPNPQEAAGPDPATRPLDIAGSWEGEFLVEGITYPSAVSIAQEDGIFAGQLSAEDITGTIEGSIGGDEFVFNLDYQRQGCTGNADATGTVTNDAQRMSGTLEIDDSCEDEALEGSFTLTRQ